MDFHLPRSPTPTMVARSISRVHRYTGYTSTTPCDTELYRLYSYTAYTVHIQPVHPIQYTAAIQRIHYTSLYTLPLPCRRYRDVRLGFGLAHGWISKTEYVVQSNSDIHRPPRGGRARRSPTMTTPREPSRSRDDALWGTLRPYRSWRDR